MTDGRVPFLGEGDARPYAAPVRRRVDDRDGSVSDRERAAAAGVDFLDELDPEPEYGPGARRVDTREADEMARRGRLQAAGVAEAERAELVAQALDGIAKWAAVPGAADAIIRELGARIHMGPGEAADLVEAERARRK